MKTYGDYGKVQILNRLTTNRGGLVQIQVTLPPTALFPKESFDIFWVRAGKTGPQIYFHPYSGNPQFLGIAG
jgi:CobQ-like glutamine amidotransferase family enzyme